MVSLGILWASEIQEYSAVQNSAQKVAHKASFML